MDPSSTTNEMWLLWQNIWGQMIHLKKENTPCEHKLHLEGQRLVCAQCGETFKL
jgi:hypothetical protein